MFGEVVAALPKNVSASLLDLILEMHMAALYGSGPVIAMQPQSRQIVLHQCWPLSCLDADSLGRRLAEFIELQRGWVFRISNDRPDVNTDDARMRDMGHLGNSRESHWPI